MPRRKRFPELTPGEAVVAYSLVGLGLWATTILLIWLTVH